MKTVAVIMGTRPEIIKLAPVIAQLRESPVLRPFVVLTGQHDDLATSALQSFSITPDVSLGLMTENQSPTVLLSSALTALDIVLREHVQAGVAIQGDTTSALAGALAAFHQQLPIAHIEAGLRTHDLSAPFPEEMNRAVISRMATLNFCPTETAQHALETERVPGVCYLVGNTVVDALLTTSARIERDSSSIQSEALDIVGKGRKILLVTGHRRENFEGPLQNLCNALRHIVMSNHDVQVVFPVHPNPNVRIPVQSELSGVERVSLLAPLNYESSIFLMKHAALIISDSGGIQEEAPSFNVPVLVTRRSTERSEALDCGVAQLINLEHPDELIVAAQRRLQGTQKRIAVKNPFGDGQAAMRIRTVLEDCWG